MMYSAVASRYAVALYKVSKVNGKTEEYKEQLKYSINCTMLYRFS